VLQQLRFKLSHDRPAKDAGSASLDRSTSNSDASISGASTRALNICFVLPPMESYSGQSGGAISTVTRQLTRSLIELGHSVEVITPDCDGGQYAEGNVHPLRYGTLHQPPDIIHKGLVLEARLRGFSWPDYGSYRRKVLRCLGQLDTPDLVIVANDPELAYTLQRKSIGRRQVLWLHNQMEGKEARRLRSVASDVALVAVSHSVAVWTADTYGIPIGAITVIHNGVDTDEFHPRDGYLRPSSPVRVICHGRIDPNKGHDVAAKAVAALRRDGVPVTFTMVGGIQTFGIPESEAQAFADGLAEAVADADGTPMGRLPAGEVAAILRDHDIACVLSKSEEPFPLSLLESMASGCAVITTGRGGIKEAVGESAVIVGADDVAAVSAAIAGLVADPGLLAERKAAARSRSELFAWADAATKVSSLFAQAGVER
jgi:glycosyltransferase involved in cell wall biosynthesis